MSTVGRRFVAVQTECAQPPPSTVKSQVLYILSLLGAPARTALCWMELCGTVQTRVSGWRADTITVGPDGALLVRHGPGHEDGLPGLLDHLDAQRRSQCQIWEAAGICDVRTSIRVLLD